MAAHGTLSPGRLWGCSSAPGTVSPRGRPSLRAPGSPARTARESGRVPAANKHGAPPRGVRDPRGREGGARPTALGGAEVPLAAAPPGLPRGRPWCEGVGAPGLGWWGEFLKDFVRLAGENE